LARTVARLGVSMATPTLRPPYGVSSPYTVDDPGVLKNPFGLGTGGGGGTGPQGPTGPSGHGSTTTTAAPTASGGNWVFTVGDTTAFNASNLPIYCSDGTNSIRGHVVSVASPTQLTVAPDSTSGTISSISTGSTFTFSGVAGATGHAGANASVYVGTTTNSGNAYTATPSPAIASYITGTLYTAQFNAANTGAVTLNISGLGAKNVYKNNAALTGAEITAGMTLALTYDGTQFQFTGDGGGSGGGGSTLPPILYATASSTQSGWEGNTLRVSVGPENVFQALSSLIASVECGTGMVINNAYACKAKNNSQGYPIEFDGTPTRLLFGGSNSVTISGAGVAISDVASVSVPAKTPIVLAFEFPSTPALTLVNNTAYAFIHARSYFKAGADASNPSTSGYATSSGGLVGAMRVHGG